jgi:FHS family glucose/mannose:H+ symporter-like MFS transporter
MTRDPHKGTSLLLLNLDFVLVGIGTTILGPILPALSSRWGMNDAHAGSLFTAQFLGSALGGLLAGIHPIRSAIAGFFTACAGLILLTLASVGSAVPVTFLYGLGVGLVMTGINLTASNIAGKNRGSVLSWLNFCWSLGATICPILTAIFVTRNSLPQFLLLLAAFYGASALVIAGRSKTFASVTGRSVQDAIPTTSLTFFIAYFSVLLFLYVGVETTLGGWLSTLATRLHHPATIGAFAISASSFFWLSLLIGRGLSPLLLRKIPETVLQPAAVGLSVLSICLLLVAQSFLGVAIAGSLAGLALAPVFPLSLSFFLSHAGQSKTVGLVFAICGTGGAVLPWITGIVSTERHSLQWGLSVPLLGAIVMLILSLYYVLSVRVDADARF